MLQKVRNLVLRIWHKFIRKARPMISDEKQKAVIQTQWNAILKLEKGLRAQKMLVGGAVFKERGSPPESYNLILVLSYSLLDEALSILIEEKEFSCPKPKYKHATIQLGTKMKAARTQISWINYPLVYAGKTARNRLAHSGTLVEKDDCIKYAYAIKSELMGWQILDDEGN